jgi:hypothetical protein
VGTMTTGSPLVFAGMTGPIRAELFSAERLEQHAESLAAAQTITDKPVPQEAPRSCRLSHCDWDTKMLCSTRLIN